MKYLVHYGIPGQRWGTRKYQYEDGTLTPAGILRYLDNGKSSAVSKLQSVSSSFKNGSSSSGSPAQAPVRSAGFWKPTTAKQSVAATKSFKFKRSLVFGNKQEEAKGSGGKGGGGKGGKGGKGGGKGSTKEEKEARDVWLHSKSDTKISEMVRNPAALQSGFSFSSYIMRRILGRSRQVTKTSQNLR